ncbi:MAG: uroporphyrinogen decarboxylase family protein [Bryobacteraceae bacterium]|nr:uroporphyrinogen decarboxylase family protein [Bryobacteraceae bacterium]
MQVKIMNGGERMRAALDGQRPDGPPVMLHNFMMAAVEAGVPMGVYRRDPAAIARCFVESVERYGYDGVLVDVDTATLAGVLGVPVHEPEDEPAVCHGARIGSLEEVGGLGPVEVRRSERVQVWLEAVRLLRAAFGGAVYIRGNCDQCPFALASQVRGAADWMMELMDPDNEERAHELLEYCTGVTVQFLELMAGAGADMLSNGDSAAGPSLVSPRLYRTFAQPYEARVVAAAHRLGLPYTLHICGKTEPILGAMVETGADALELDSLTDASRARDALAGRAAFIGNLDPTAVLALGTPGEVEAQTRRLMKVFAGERRFVLNAGCAIAPNTPAANIEAMIRVAREGYEE